MHNRYTFMNNLNWDGFRFFVAAAETGSLTAAAKKLGSNQPTAGRQIDALESALGIKLFQRSAKGLRLTEEGAVIFEQSQTMQSSVINIQRSISQCDEEVSGTVRVALPEGLCMEVLTPLLPLFYQRYPDIRLILNVSSNTANLTRGEADIAVRLFRPTEKNLVAKRLGFMSLGLFAAPAYLEAYGRPKTSNDLKKHRLITYGDQLSRLPENQWLLKYAAPSLAVLSCDNTMARLKATLAGVGISIQPNIFFRNNTGIAPVLKNTKLPTHEAWLVYHNDLRHSARISAVVDFIGSNFDIK